MCTKNLPFDDSSEREIVEELSKHFPHIVIFILSHTLIVKTVILCDASGFVVSPQNGQTFFVSHLKTQKQTDSLEGIISSIYVISQKKIVGVGDVSSNSEQLHQVVELPVHISTNIDWSSHRDNIGFLSEDLSE